MFTVITMTTSMARKVTPAVTTAAVNIAAIDYDVDREKAMNEKYAKFSLSQLRHRQRSLMQLKKIPSRILRIVCRIYVQRMSELITLSPAM